MHSCNSALSFEKSWEAHYNLGNSLADRSFESRGRGGISAAPQSPPVEKALPTSRTTHFASR